jgi:hypothetical protein
MVAVLPVAPLKFQLDEGGSTAVVKLHTVEYALASPPLAAFTRQ